MFAFASIPCLLGVVLAATRETVQVTNQSVSGSTNNQPITNNDRKGQLDTPEVVLSVKYDGGSTDGIYLAQYRKGKIVPRPSVPEGRQLCLDLCHAGLGGEGCGSSCQALMPVGLLEYTKQEDKTTENTDQLTDDTDVSANVGFGQPRMGVCPTLCLNNLGYPLCGCSAELLGNTMVPSWGDVCDTFCTTDGYTLRGCPTCEPSSPPVSAGLRILDTADGWTAWCNIQCRQGHGGAACSCDLSPFSRASEAVDGPVHREIPQQ